MPADFLDSNVILYFASGDPARADRAEALIVAGGTISVQVLNEVAHAGLRKFRFTWEELEGTLDRLRLLFEVEPLLPSTHDAGLAIARRYRLSIYDSMIVAAALQGGCDTLWSEDMQNGLVVDGRLTIRNPFV